VQEWQRPSFCSLEGLEPPVRAERINFGGNVGFSSFLPLTRWSFSCAADCQQLTHQHKKSSRNDYDAGFLPPVFYKTSVKSFGFGGRFSDFVFLPRALKERVDADPLGPDPLAGDSGFTIRNARFSAIAMTWKKRLKNGFESLKSKIAKT
jgi:hypothetical protein